VRGRYRYTVRFTGVESTPSRIKRHATKLRGILANSTPEAIDRARELVACDPRLKKLYYPTYAVVGIED
jgi:hypothetical protein